MPADRLMGMLTLCRRAGRLALGYDQVKESVQKTNACLILLAQDISPKTAGKIRALAEEAGVPVREGGWQMAELETFFRKRVGVLAVNDAGFAAALLKRLGEAR